LALAACGSSDKTETSSGTTSSDTATTASSGTSTAAAPAADLNGKVVKLGFVGPLTGPLAIGGKGMLDGIKAGVAYLNATPDVASGVKYEIVSRDTEGNPAKDVAAARELIGQGVTAIMGDIAPGTTPAMEPIINASKVLSFNTNNYGYDTESGADKKFPYAYSVGDPSDAFSDVAMKTLADAGVKVVGDLNEATAFGKAQQASDEKAAAAHGLKLVSESFPPTATDTTAQIQKLKDSGAEAVLLWTYTPIPALTSFAKVDWNVPIGVPQIASAPFVLDPLKKAAPDVAKRMFGMMAPQKMMLPSATAKPTDPVVIGYQKFVPKVTGHPLTGNDLVAAFGFDIPLVLDGAIKKAQSVDTTDLQQALDSGTPFPGVRWDYVFGPAPEQRAGVPASAQASYDAGLGMPGGLFVGLKPGSLGAGG